MIETLYLTEHHDVHHAIFVLLPASMLSRCYLSAMSLKMHQDLIHLQQVLSSIADISNKVWKGLQVSTCHHST